METPAKPFPLLINGGWRERSEAGHFENRNPADPDEVIGLFAMATESDVDEAVAAARAALPAWASTPPVQRGAILDRAAQLIDARRDDLARDLTREEGKTFAEARGEVVRARDLFRYYGGEGWRAGGRTLPGSGDGELLYTRREPLGVISIITPWNFPIAIPAWKIAPALAYGNTVVFKPAEDTPLSGIRLAEILVEAGLPAGVLNVLTGDGPTVGGAMVRHPDVDGVSFTGSYEVGTRVYAQAIEHLARVQLEMGGKNGLVVLADADLDLAVDLAVRGGFGLTGQACTATSRVLVEDGIADAYAARLAEAADALAVGSGLERGVRMGPAINRAQLEIDQRYMELGVKEGARLLAGGSVDGRAGYFPQPTVFDHVEPQMRIAQEEIFGPVIGLIRVRDLDDAIEKSNAIGFGLSAGIVTNHLKHAFAFANRVQAGVVKINSPTTGVALNAPFGGFKNSSANTFKEMGEAAIEFYTRTKTVYVDHGGG